MVETIVLLLIGAGIVYFIYKMTDGTGEPVGTSDSITDKYKKHKNLRMMLKEKYWALHTEAMARKRDYHDKYKKDFEALEESDEGEGFLNHVQQMGKITLLSWLLQEMGEHELVNRVLEEQNKI